MAVNDNRLMEENKRDIGFANQKLDGETIVITLFNLTQTVKNNPVTLFSLDATGGTIRKIRLNFYLVADAAATFTIYISKTRPADLVTFTQDLVLTYAIATPAVAGNYSYDLGDLPEGLQANIIIAQNNAGNANDAVDSELVYEGVL